MTRSMRLGIDIGRVIIDGSAHPAGGDTTFFTGDDAALLATPEVAGAVASIARLVGLFAGRVWLVSKCGPRVEKRTLRWLEGHRFHERTGVARDHLRFCRARAEKRYHCEKLGLTHFIDDRPEVHSAIQGVVDHQYVFGPQSRAVPDYGIVAPAWPAVEALIRQTLTSDPQPIR